MTAVAEQTLAQRYGLDCYLPIEAWGHDHWTTLGYADSVAVDCAGFQIGADARMRSTRRSLRVMRDQCPRPKRTTQSTADIAVAMGPNDGSELADGSVLAGHDDWACIQDMAAAGLFDTLPSNIEPERTIHLTDRGRAFVAELRAQKATGGRFANFKPSAGLLKEIA